MQHRFHMLNHTPSETPKHLREETGADREIAQSATPVYRCVKCPPSLIVVTIHAQRQQWQGGSQTFGHTRLWQFSSNTQTRLFVHYHSSSYSTHKHRLSYSCVHPEKYIRILNCQKKKKADSKFLQKVQIHIHQFAHAREHTLTHTSLKSGQYNL